MAATRKTPARRVLSTVVIALLALAGGTALAVSGEAQPAQAVFGDVDFVAPTAEGTPVTHSPFLFHGIAGANDPVTISTGIGPDCHAVADGAGDWTCLTTLTSSIDVIVLNVSRDVDDGNPATQEASGREFPIALPVSVNETQPGQVLTNNSIAPITGSGAWPTATMLVSVGGIPATCGAADGAGNWSCTPPALADGSYAISAQQDVGAATSDATASTYVLDTTTFIPRFATPFDSTLPPAGIQTSDSTPTVGGGAGDAEPFGTVTVYASDFGVAPPAHPNGGPGNFWCNAVADNTGAWSCTGPALTVGHYWDFGATQVDQAGNATGSPDDEFDIHILPPPAAPVVFNPQPGFGEISPFVANGTVDVATTSVRIREGATDLCGVIIPAGGNWSCPALGLSVGPHTLDFLAFDTYGTSSTTTRSVDSWGPPTIVTPANGSSTSASTVHVTGYAPIGSDLQIRLNSNPICNIVPVTTSYDCLTPLLAVPFGHGLEVDYTDPWGTPSGTIVSGFTTVPTLPAPAFVTPTLGYQSATRTVHVSTTNAAEGTVFVREGLFNLCPPTPVAVTSFSCTTSQLAVGSHTITISQTDQYGVMSASAQRVVTILPTPNLPLTRKTFGFSVSILGEDGAPIGDEGVGTGDLVTIVASQVPPGTKVEAELHSDPVALGGMTIGQTGQLLMRVIVPAVPPGQHEIVVGATAPGYWPGTVASPLAVHGLKQIGDPETEIKQLGEPQPVKQVGSPQHATGTGAGGGSGGTNAHGFTDPTVFGSSVDSPFDPTAHAFALSPAGLVLSGSIAIAFLLLVGLPAELLESTIRSNYDRAFGWLARLRRRVGRMLAPVARLLANPWVGTGLTILAASFLLGFADPDFGPNGASVRLMLAMILAVVTINIGISLIVMRVAGRAFDVAAVLRPMPAALGIVAVSVLVSRLAGISPGFLFGVVLGVAYARELKLRDEARLGVLGVALTIAAGLVAWVGYGVASVASGPGFFNNLLIETLAAITLEALGTLVIALLPIEFLDGRTIFRWSKVGWLALYAVTLLVFLFVVVPMSDNWGTMSAPIFGWGTLFAVFAAVAIITWAVFRRRARVRPSTPAAAAPRPRARR